MRPISQREPLPRWVIAIMVAGAMMAVGGALVYVAMGGTPLLLLPASATVFLPVIPWAQRRRARDAARPDFRTP